MIQTSQLRARTLIAALLMGASMVAWGECQDPTQDRQRFRIQGVEMTDTRTQLVWLRCPAGYVAPNGACDSSRVLPSTHWADAMSGVLQTPQTPAGNWRLASVEEWETIAAKGCGYLVNDQYIELMFSTVWTRSLAGDDMVWLMDQDAHRIKSSKTPKNPKTGGEFYAQTIYVRDLKQ